MRKLSELPNIGKVLEDYLIKAGIDNPEILYQIGSKEAFLRIRQIDPTACIRVLYGLEGAALGIKDSQLSQDTKKELLEFYRSLQ